MAAPGPAAGGAALDGGAADGGGGAADADGAAVDAAAADVAAAASAEDAGADAGVGVPNRLRGARVPAVAVGVPEAGAGVGAAKLKPVSRKKH